MNARFMFQLTKKRMTVSLGKESAPCSKFKRSDIVNTG